MTAAILLQPLCFREFDNNGNPLAFGTVASYQAGTTTPTPTYTDSTAGTPNANPLTLNARGEAQIWCLPNVSYKFVVEDSAGNTIRTVDNVQQSQVLSLYGGTDTGVANAYILTFTASFNAYADGIVIYWVPSNSNTSASTINVNGLGVITIVNQDGSALSASQLIANEPAQILIKGGKAILLSNVFTSGSFTGTLTGPYASAQTGTFNYVLDGRIARVWPISDISANTSSSASILISGLPAILVPTANRFIPIGDLISANVAGYSGSATVQSGGGISIYLSTVSSSLIINGNFGSGSVCGIGSECVISYPL